MRLLGGKVQVDEVGDEIADMLEGSESGAAEPFDRRERVMISGALTWPSSSDPDGDNPAPRRSTTSTWRPAWSRSIRNWSTRRIRVCWSRGRVAADEPLGYIHNKELLKELLQGQAAGHREPAPRSRSTCRTAPRCSAPWSRCARPGPRGLLAIEFGGFEGLLTLTDILEAIAGELPDASEMAGPGHRAVEAGATRSAARINLACTRERLGFQARPTEDYQTLPAWR